MRGWPPSKPLRSVGLRLVRSMAGRSDAYKNAVATLNSLQSNSQIIQQLRDRRQEMAQQNILETRFYLKVLGITNTAINRLRPIHVTGTKGKGSTCAFTETILRRTGLRTGFYSSPHLVHVRERIRINGDPLTEELFTSYFNDVYEAVKKASVDYSMPMPAYFKFLTLMAFHVFIHENVDVMVVEVGIGGEHDCTNVIEKPYVCGITLLDYDHTSLLGSTLAEIAWHKAGIAKPDRPLITVPQDKNALAVIRNRVDERSAFLVEFQQFNEFKFSPGLINYVLAIGLHHEDNISLAVNLARVWLREYAKDNKDAHLPELHNEFFEEAIRLTHWPGRNQILEKGNITFYLDGAHTPKSIQSCAQWYSYQKSLHATEALQVLVFQCTADRDPATLLPLLLHDNHFDLALFTTTRLNPILDKQNDNTNLNANEQSQSEKCRLSAALWKERSGKVRILRPKCDKYIQDNAIVFDCIKDVVDRLQNLGGENERVDVLVTGSLHLVGGVLSFVES